ncbi:hypothetical protein F4861DRAFT_542767 [Xylaria intraflava]|nr:hypothetical protein F4861DRAFT_542767 [Xylaria intraflava]
MGIHKDLPQRWQGLAVGCFMVNQRGTRDKRDRQALQGRENALGPVKAHHDAEEIRLQAAQGSEQVSGPDLFYTLDLNSPGVICSEQGGSRKLGCLYRRALPDYEKDFRSDTR